MDTSDLSHYRVEERLRDGRTVIVRAIRSDDKQAMLDAYHELGPRTIYLRFFAAHGEPTAAELRAWTEVDFASVVRLIVCLPGAEGERIVGGASYVMRVAGDPAAGAEISFTVEDDFQGQGIGGKLLQHLVRIARAAGITHFVADTLLENHPMLSVFEESGLPMRRRLGGGTVQVRLDLAT